MDVICSYHRDMARYDLGPAHPLKPERFTLAVELMDAYGLIDGADGRAARLVAPAPLGEADLELIHDRSYIDTVKAASDDPAGFRPRAGIGPGDTPARAGIHEAASLIAGGTACALSEVLRDTPARSFAPAGGLHHAHRHQAAGFCVYNDPAIAIAMALRDRPGTRVAYVDIDAHHGDGVQEAFYETDEVLTISIHEAGTHLFPGTGSVQETGAGAGRGYSINVPLPPYAGDACYRLADAHVVRPALTAFAPDAIVLQCGADAHHADPLTHLGMTLPGYRALVSSIIETAERTCDGRITCTGGGGYGTYSVVPRAWTIVLAELLGVRVPATLPESWRKHASSLSGEPSPLELCEDLDPVSAEAGAGLLDQTERVIDAVRSASPLLG